MGEGHEDSPEGAQVETSHREMSSERCRPSSEERNIDPVESPERHKRKDKKTKPVWEARADKESGLQEQNTFT